jgi:hypothetical protein
MMLRLNQTSSYIRACISGCSQKEKMLKVVGWMLMTSGLEQSHQRLIAAVDAAKIRGNQVSNAKKAAQKATKTAANLAVIAQTQLSLDKGWLQHSKTTGKQLNDQLTAWEAHYPNRTTAKSKKKELKVSACIEAIDRFIAEGGDPALLTRHLGEREDEGDDREEEEEVNS